MKKDVRNFGQIKRSLKAVETRVRALIAKVGEKGLPTEGYNAWLLSAIGARNPILTLLDAGRKAQVNEHEAQAIADSLDGLTRMELQLKQVVSLSEKIDEAGQHLESEAAEAKPLLLRIAEGVVDCTLLQGFITHAANPTEMVDPCRQHLDAAREHLRAGNVQESSRELDRARAFCTRQHLLKSLIQRNRLTTA